MALSLHLPAVSPMGSPLVRRSLFYTAIHLGGKKCTHRPRHRAGAKVQLHLVALEEVGYRLKGMGDVYGFGKERCNGEDLYLVAWTALLEWNGIGDNE